MAYRQPAFMFDTVLAGRTLAQVVARNAAALSDASKRALIDQRAGPSASVVATGANAGVEFDLGFIGAKPYTRAVFARGHNLAAETVRIISDTTAGMTTPTVHGTQVIGSQAEAIDFALVAGSSDRYWGFEVTTSSAETFLIAEFALGVFNQLTAAAAVAPNWAQGFTAETRSERFAGRESIVALAPPRRRLSLTVANVVGGSTDDGILSEVARLGEQRPFWYWPPDDALAPVLVRLTDSSIVQEFPAPTVSIRYRYELAMLEQLA